MFAQHGFKYRLFLDGLPAAVINPNTKELNFQEGIPVAEYIPEGRKVKIFNHLDFTVEVSETFAGGQRIVGFEVAYGSYGDSSTYTEAGTGAAYLEENKKITYSFSVTTKVRLLSNISAWYKQLGYSVRPLLEIRRQQFSARYPHRRVPDNYGWPLDCCCIHSAEIVEE